MRRPSVSQQNVLQNISLPLLACFSIVHTSAITIHMLFCLQEKVRQSSVDTRFNSDVHVAIEDVFSDELWLTRLQ